MELGISGKVALVCGGSSGIGRAIAEGLIAEGAHVAVSSSNEQKLSQTASEIGAAAHKTWDTNNVEGAGELVHWVESELGPVEILVVNTGGPPANADPLAFSDQQWDDAHRNLVRAPMALLRPALPGMRERKFGRVINVVSTSVREPIPNLMLSNAERSATVAAFKTLSRECASDGVTLNSLLTGMIATDRLAQLFGDSIDAAAAVASHAVPAGRLGTPEEMAAAAVFLASEAAAYITGTAIPVDGGRLAGVW